MEKSINPIEVHDNDMNYELAKKLKDAGLSLKLP